MQGTSIILRIIFLYYTGFMKKFNLTYISHTPFQVKKTDISYVLDK